MSTNEAALPQSTVRVAQADPDGILLVIHAGAGNRGKKDTPERRAQVEQDLNRALEAGYALLEQGAPAEDAVCAAIRVMEDAPEFNAGRGAALTSEGIVSMDSCLMTGVDGEVGSACGLTTSKNPINVARAIKEKLRGDELPPVGTPYQAALEILAFHRAGLHETALSRLRTIWGGMLRLGATTFFEAYDASQTGNERYAFYRRPYGLSLCHTWSAGPAALLPILFFGCEPTSDGWRTFRLAPSPLCRGKEAATIPTPAGAIRLWREEGRLREEFPPEITPEVPRSTGNPDRRDG